MSWTTVISVAFWTGGYATACCAERLTSGSRRACWRTGGSAGPSSAPRRVGWCRRCWRTSTSTMCSMCGSRRRCNRVSVAEASSSATRTTWSSSSSRNLTPTGCIVRPKRPRRFGSTSHTRLGSRWRSLAGRPVRRRQGLPARSGVRHADLGECEHAIDVESLALDLAAPLNLGSLIDRVLPPNRTDDLGRVRAGDRLELLYAAREAVGDVQVALLVRRHPMRAAEASGG